MDAYTETFDVDVSKKFIRFDEKNRVVYQLSVELTENLDAVPDVSMDPSVPSANLVGTVDANVSQRFVIKRAIYDRSMFVSVG